MKCSFTELTWPDRWFFGGDACDSGDDDAAATNTTTTATTTTATTTTTTPPTSSPPLVTADADVDAVESMFASIAASTPYPPDGDDVSARAWMRRAGCTRRQQAIADACFANDFGASLDELGVTELITENRLWDAGETYLVPDRPFSAMVAHLAAGLPAGAVRTRWPVTRVTVDDEGGGDGDGVVTLTGPAGTLRARRVVLTIPLAVLQAGVVAFDPPLPPAKLDAVARLRVGRAIKLVLTFERRIWPADFFDAVCPGCAVPEWWVKRYPVDEGAGDNNSVENNNTSPHAITGFLCGSFADCAAAAGRAATLASALAQLDAMFGTPDDATPASTSLVASHVADWSAEPWARGGYSFPSLGAFVGDRAALAAPSHGGLVLWAGEATHAAVNPCLQAAVETGLRAAGEVGKS